jgi:hypothetical protein
MNTPFFLDAFIDISRTAFGEFLIRNNLTLLAPEC